MTKRLISNHKIHTIDNLSLEYDSEAELIPLLTPEDEEEMINEELPDSLPIYRCGTWYYFWCCSYNCWTRSIKLINDKCGRKIMVKDEEMKIPHGISIQLGPYQNALMDGYGAGKKTF
jgi:hypothetical protein